MNARYVVSMCFALAVAAACDDSPTEPPALPDPTTDQVGPPPADYATLFGQFYVFDRADNRQVRVIYANDAAMAGPPFPRGSILVMETYAAQRDAQGVPIRGTDGRYLRGARGATVFVMRKEEFFGRRYGEHQTGEWEYASFFADSLTVSRVVGDAAAAACAICHLDAGPSRDWVYRANLRSVGASGAVPQDPPAGQPADQPSILNYTFLPGETTVNVDTRVTWRNDDEVKHTVTAMDGSFSLYVSQGATAGRDFETAGTYEYYCAIHPNMRGTVTVVAQP